MIWQISDSVMVGGVFVATAMVAWRLGIKPVNRALLLLMYLVCFCLFTGCSLLLWIGSTTLFNTSVLADGLAWGLEVCSSVWIAACTAALIRLRRFEI